MTQYMLLFSLGSVQSFIGQARKTRDLWLGSFLLSAFMQVCMEGIESKALIFPSTPFIYKRIPDLPNKYLAVFDDPGKAVATAQQSEAKIKAFWQDICQDVWGSVLAKPMRENPALFSQITSELWKRQTDPAHLFEIFWVVVEGDSENYTEWLKKTQSAFDGRKHLRNFQQQEEYGEKSTISGLRSALCGSGDQRSDVQKFWQKVAELQSPRDIDRDGSERLDAIDTVKRFVVFSKSFKKKFNIPDSGPESVGFPSTSSIAAATFLERLIGASEDPLLSSSISAWMKEATKLDETMPATIPLLNEHASHYTLGAKILELDGDCLFPETFSTARLKKEFGLSDESAQQLARSGPKALSALFRTTDMLIPPITRPTPYYAMIHTDGDKMGKLISGVQDKDEYQDISQALSNFSRQYAPALVEGGYPGRMVYAGGDDVFALAPLIRDLTIRDGEAHQIRTVLDLIDQLQKQYRNVVQQAVIDPVRKTLVTASAGITIAHHYTSHSYVHRVTKAAEQLAKNHYGRNALVVTVLRRSGEQTRVGCHWRYPDLEADAQPIPLFLAFYELFKDDVLSPKCVFSLLEEAPTLVVLSLSAQVSEVKRVLRRQRNPALEESLADDEILQKAKSLITLAGAMDKDEYPQADETQKLSVELHSSSRRYGLVEVLGWLLVMLFLARKEQE